MTKTIRRNYPIRAVLPHDKIFSTYCSTPKNRDLAFKEYYTKAKAHLTLTVKEKYRIIQTRLSFKRNHLTTHAPGSSYSRRWIERVDSVARYAPSKHSTLKYSYSISTSRHRLSKTFYNETFPFKDLERFLSSFLVIVTVCGHHELVKAVCDEVVPVVCTRSYSVVQVYGFCW